MCSDKCYSCLLEVWIQAFWLFHIWHLGLWLNALGCSFLVSMASLICLIILPVIFGKQFVCHFHTMQMFISQCEMPTYCAKFWLIWVIHLFQFKGNHQRLLLIHWLYLGSGFFKLLSLVSLSYSLSIALLSLIYIITQFEYFVLYVCKLWLSACW